MSYEIESRKLCITYQLPSYKEDNRFPTYGQTELTLFCVESCSNNVHPRTPRWHVVAADVVSAWQGRPMLPKIIWDCARDADGGMIKPDGRNTSGTAYIRQWQQAYANRVAAADAPYRPSSIIAYSKDANESWPHAPLTLAEIEALDPRSPRWSRYDFEAVGLREAWMSLPWRGSDSMRKAWCNTPPGGPNLWLNAFYLFLNRHKLPAMVCIQ